MYNSKYVKNPKNYEYWLASVSEMPLESTGLRYCGECGGGGGGSGGGGGCSLDDELPLRSCSK